MLSRLLAMLLFVLALPACEATDDAAEPDASTAPSSCDEPATQRVETFDIFTYEASRPDDGGPGACSRAGVPAWGTVTWDAADAACDAIGWRLCTSAELLRACGGPSGTMYTWGANFVGGLCNLREAYVAPGGEGRASAAPTGAFPECRSAEGIYDLTGNLWEWAADPPPGDPGGHAYQGAGWKTIAQLHHDESQACAQQTALVAAFAATYADDHVGFRCCRDAP